MDCRNLIRRPKNRMKLESLTEKDLPLIEKILGNPEMMKGLGGTWI